MGDKRYRRPHGYRPPASADDLLERRDRGERYFEGAQLAGAQLEWHPPLANVNLSYADLSGANLRHFEFLNCDLSHANLRGAWLDHAGLGFCSLAHADLRNARLYHTRLAFVSLYATVLNNVLDASTIEVRPDDAARLRTASSTGPSCFVSYASPNAAADEVAAALQRGAIPHWYRPLSTWFDDDVADHLRRIISTSDVFLLVLSQGALDRPFVQSEVSEAVRLHELRSTPRIVVVRTDDTALPTSGPFSRLPCDVVIDARPVAPAAWRQELLAAVAR